MGLVRCCCTWTARIAGWLRTSIQINGQVQNDEGGVGGCSRGEQAREPVRFRFAAAVWGDSQLPGAPMQAIDALHG